MNAEQRREFVRTQRTCVVGYTRRLGPPSLSIVDHAMDGDDMTVVNRSKVAEGQGIAASAALNVALGRMACVASSGSGE